jgi:hypothetical protein
VTFAKAFAGTLVAFLATPDAWSTSTPSSSPSPVRKPRFLVSASNGKAPARVGGRREVVGERPQPAGRPADAAEAVHLEKGHIDGHGGDAARLQERPAAHVLLVAKLHLLARLRKPRLPSRSRKLKTFLEGSRI